MAKKKSNSSVGYSLVKASRRRRVRSTKVGTAVSTAPTTAGQMRSITEETDLEQFFAKAEMRGRDFAAEKLDPKVILNSVSFPQEIAAPSVPCFDYLPNKLRMPRKPDWRLAGNAEAFLQLEQKAFVEWRKDLEDLQQKGGYILTPFEKNLDIWRQLWRVIERSDVVVELLDSRNPLMFRVPDLEAAVKETCPNKVVFLLLSKADLLTSKQRQFWADYLTDRGDHFAFWSNADDRTQKETEAQDDEMESPIAESDTASSVSGKGNADAAEAVEERTLQATTTLQAGELLSILKGLRPDVDTSQRPIVIGMVGYPNVGKSSTINKILGAKRAAVSATPGKTKHLQTLIVDHDVTLCDAPGLVFPALHFGRHHMLLAGMLSSDHITDYATPIRFLCSTLPFRVFERHYGIVLTNSSYVDSADHVDPEVLLTALAFVRGFMSTKGIPDRSRAARCIIKDCTSGRLPYCVAPPGVDEALFNAADDQAPAPLAEMAGKLHSLSIFSGGASAVHVLSRKEKPAVAERRKQPRHRKREKLRRVFAHLDA